MKTHQLAATLAAGSLLLAACSGDDPTTTPTATASPATTDGTASGTEPTAPGTGPTGVAPTAGGTTDGPTTTPSPTPSPTSEDNPNPEGVDPTPIPPGEYRYDTEGWSQLAGGPKEHMPTVTTITAATPNGSRQDITQDTTTSDGYGQVTTRTMEYGDDGFLLHEIHSVGKVKVGLLGDVNVDQQFVADPPGQLGSPDSDVGWTTTFTMEGDGTTLTVTAKLLRFQDITIGGLTVRTAVVRQDVVFEGELTGNSTTTSWVRPEDLLILRERSRTEASQGGVKSTTDYEINLQSLSPS